MGSNGYRNGPLDRLALPRLLRGRKRVAFVLSGGGSLGALQVGMLQALFDAGIRPDMLVGTSVGAINAAWVGAWPEAAGIQKLADIWRGLKRDDIFPLGLTAAMGLLGRGKHLISNHGLRSVIERHLPYERIEHAIVPIHIVTTDLKSGRAVVLSSGEVVPALLASAAIPGVFPPVTIGKHELVDGGVANHTPIAAAIERGAQQIYVLPIGYPWLHETPSNALGMALQALARLVEQRLEQEISMYAKTAEILTVPSLEPIAVSPADFSHTSELMERGYGAAVKLLQNVESGRRATAQRSRKSATSPAAA
ncbi:MAG TPA: patatin-like phospholipase family protein [Candidatus Dormibacteraeota bacterium]|nr:patatin-like phospholipase family protein [Candidatus Dormibacteraeota bacterium]